jgi:hypothetical protein
MPDTFPGVRLGNQLTSDGDGLPRKARKPPAEVPTVPVALVVAASAG